MLRGSSQDSQRGASSAGCASQPPSRASPPLHLKCEPRSRSRSPLGAGSARGAGGRLKDGGVYGGDVQPAPPPLWSPYHNGAQQTEALRRLSLEHELLVRARLSRADLLPHKLGPMMHHGTAAMYAAAAATTHPRCAKAVPPAPPPPLIPSCTAAGRPHAPGGPTPTLGADSQTHPPPPTENGHDPHLQGR